LVTLGPANVKSVVRQPKGGYGLTAPYRTIAQGERFVIRRLLNPRDEAVDIGGDAYAAALAQTIATPPKRRRRSDQPPTQPSGTFLRVRRSPRTGLLLLYPLARRTRILQPDGTRIEHEFLLVPTPPIGLGISFPASARAQSVTYVVNSIYGDSDDDEGDA
jgi:hypothetical protein